MIEGRVNVALEAVTTLRIEGPSGQWQEVEAVIDTGYSGFLTLPISLVKDFGLAFFNKAIAVLADGTQGHFDVYDAVVVWGGQSRPKEVDATDGAPLLGMQMLYSHSLNVEVVEGGRVVVQELDRG